MKTFNLVYPASYCGNPPQGKAIGYGRETKTQVIITKAQVVEGNGVHCYVSEKNPARFNKKTGRKVGLHWTTRSWELEK